MTTPQLTPVDPPFIQIEGVFNVRSVGGYATSSNETLRVKPNLLFRSGELSAITPNGAHALSSLGINTIFDLRATNEIQKFKTSSPNMGNVTIVHVPVGQEVNFSHEYTTAFLRKFETDELNAFIDFYQGLLTNIGSALEAAVRHIINNPDHPLLIHCTVGKDRTGMLVAIILLLLGVDEVDIAREYSLTTVGLKPVWDMMTVRVNKAEAFRNNPVGAQNLGSSKMESMIAALRVFKDKNGGAEQYVLQTTALTTEDIEALRKNALTSL